MILLLIWIALKILKTVIMPCQTPPSKLSKPNPFSVPNPVSGDPDVDSRRSRLKQISALLADPEHVVLDVPPLPLSLQKQLLDHLQNPPQNPPKNPLKNPLKLPNRCLLKKPSTKRASSKRKTTSEVAEEVPMVDEPEEPKPRKTKKVISTAAASIAHFLQ